VKRTLRFARSIGMLPVQVSPGWTVTVPVFPGILKHPTLVRLPELLRNPNVLRKYTREALRIASWHLLREFPRDWLLENLPAAGVRPGRQKALEFLLG